MICGKCGTENPNGAKFCHKCGNPLADVPPKQEKTPKAEPTPPQQKGLASNTVHRDSVCPFCGSENCQPLMRNITKVKSSGYHASSGCCGLCLLGPFGLLCGLCGTGSKIDVKNETVWVCQKCGKQHLSQADALEKAKVMAASSMMNVLLVALLLSAGFFSGSLGWIFPLIWVFSPLVAWLIVETDLDNELGYPFKEVLPAGDSIKKYLILAEIATVAVLLFGGPILVSFLAGL